MPCISPGQLPFERNGTLLKVRNTDYFNDGRVVVDSVGVGRFKVKNNLIIDGYDAATVERVIDVPPRESDMGRLATLSTLGLKIHEKFMFNNSHSSFSTGASMV